MVKGGNGSERAQFVRFGSKLDLEPGRLPRSIEIKQRLNGLLRCHPVIFKTGGGDPDEGDLAFGIHINALGILALLKRFQLDKYHD